MVILSLLLLDVLIMVMNRFSILLLLFVCASIEIGSSLMILFMGVLSEWVMIDHVRLLELVPFVDGS